MEAQSGRAVTSRRPWRRRGWVLVASLLLACLGLELAVRGALRLRGTPWSQTEARAALEGLHTRLFQTDWRPPGEAAPAQHMAGNLILHPFLGWDTVAAQGMYPRVAENMAGRKGSGPVHVVVVGGSVSCLLVTHARQRLVAGLQEDSRWQGRPVEVHVLGQGGMKQPQQLMSLNYVLALGWKPDLVINVDGFNEVALGYKNTDYGAHPLHPSTPHWAHLIRGRTASGPLEQLRREMVAVRERAGAFVDFTLGRGVLHSAVAGNLAWREVRRLVGRFHELQGQYVREMTTVRDPSLHGPPYVPDIDAVLREVVNGWEQSSISLHALLAARGIVYLHVLQPTLHDEGSKPLTEEEQLAGVTDEFWAEGCRVGYPLLRAAGESLRERGVHFLDASMLFADVEESLYYDACHFSAPGSEMLADAITAELRRAAN